MYQVSFIVVEYKFVFVRSPCLNVHFVRAVVYSLLLHLLICFIHSFYPCAYIICLFNLFSKHSISNLNIKLVGKHFS